MTKSDKQRAEKLRKVSMTYCGIGRTSIILLLTSALILIIMLLFWFFAREDNELYILPFLTAELTLLPMMSGIFSTIWLGDGYTTVQNSGAVNGSVFTGTFFCSLPFEARDVHRMRLIDWKKGAAVSAALMAAAQTFCMIAEAQGYAMLRSFAGIGTLAAILMAALGLFVCLINRQGLKFTVLAACWATFIIPCGIFSEHNNAAAFFTAVNEKLSGLGIFYGIGGIIAYIAAAVLLGLLGERVLSRRKNISWNLK